MITVCHSPVIIRLSVILSAVQQIPLGGGLSNVCLTILSRLEITQLEWDFYKPPAAWTPLIFSRPRGRSKQTRPARQRHRQLACLATHDGVPTTFLRFTYFSGSLQCWARHGQDTRSYQPDFCKHHWLRGMIIFFSFSFSPSFSPFWC